MKLFNTRLALFLSAIFTAQANAQVDIKSIQIVEDHYAVKVLKVKLEYDGSQGTVLSFGASPITRRATYAKDHYINTFREGSSEHSFPLNRPDTRDNTAIESWGIRFLFYGSAGDQQYALEESFEIHWLDIKDHFQIEDSPNQLLTSVSSITVNEALPNADQLITWLGQRSLKQDQMKIYHTEVGSSSDSALDPFFILSISEDINFDDANRIFQKIAQLEIPVDLVQVQQIDSPGYELGNVSLDVRGSMITGGVDTRPVPQLAQLQTLKEVYDNLNFEPTPAAEYSSIIIDRVIELNDYNSGLSGRQAQELANYLLERDPDQPRAYVELARSEYRINSDREAVIAAKNIMQLALIIFPKDAYVNHYAGFVEYDMQEYEKALEYFQLAEQYRDEEIIWLINNWANTFLSMGRTEEALEKFSTLLEFNDLNKSDSRAAFFGLSDYVSALTEQQNPQASVVFEKLIENFPDRAKCIPIQYAQHILFSEADTNKALQVLGRGDKSGCADYSAVAALVDIYDWHNSKGNRAQLYRSFLKHPEIDELIYKVANSYKPTPILIALKDNGIDLDQINADGLSPLHQAILDSNAYAITALASAGANIHTSKEDEIPLLVYAIMQESASSVMALLAAGADPSEELETGYTIRDIANELGDDEIISLIAEDKN